MGGIVVGTTVRLALVALLGLVLAAAPAAAAQCSMCRENAAAAGAEGAQALRLGILVLLVPTLALFAGVLAFAARRREPGGEASAGPEALSGPPPSA